VLDVRHDLFYPVQRADECADVARGAVATGAVAAVRAFNASLAGC
jgi:hypothetical protein